VRLLGASLIVLVLAPAAFAAQLVARGDIDRGPQLARDRVVWVSGLEVKSAVPGEPPTTLFRFARPVPPTEVAITDLAVSATHLAIGRSAFTPTARQASEVPLPPRQGASSATLVAGRLGGPFTLVTKTGTEAVLSGSRLAYVDTVARGSREREEIVVVDLDRPARRRTVAVGSWEPAGVEHRRSVGTVRIAGRFVAWRLLRGAYSYARVMDLRTGRVRRVDRIEEAGDVLEWFAVSPNGALAVTYGALHELATVDARGRIRKLAIHMPNSIGRDEPGTTSLAYVGGRVAYVDENFRFLLTAPARLIAKRRFVGEPDFNGTYAAWATRGAVWRAGPFR
jgi:hypothetical protein